MAQPNKGPRGQIGTRAPLAQHSVYERRAAELGIPVGDYSVLVLALAHGLDVPDYILKKIKPDQLQLLDAERLSASIKQLAMGA